MRNEENNLISIDEVISRAKRLGVDFGKGDPRERLRYLTKLGLLPHAKRKSFNGQPSQGAYPEYVIELLKEIDEKIKAGKSIQEIKKEKERKNLIEEIPSLHILYPHNIYSHALEVQSPAVEREPYIAKIEKEQVVSLRPFRRISSIFKFFF